MGAELSGDLNWRALRVRLFELGHSFHYIDNELNIKDMSDYLAYTSAIAKAQEKSRKKNGR